MLTRTQRGSRTLGAARQDDNTPWSGHMFISRAHAWVAIYSYLMDVLAFDQLV
jgi:hypothetical protein